MFTPGTLFSDENILDLQSRQYLRVLFTEFSYNSSIYDLTVPSGDASLNGLSDGLRLSGIRFYAGGSSPHPAVDLTGTSAPSPYTASSSIPYFGHLAWEAFDISDLTDSARWIADCDNPAVPPVYIAIDLGPGNKAKPNRVDLAPDSAASSGYFPTAFKVQGSSTGAWAGEEVTYYTVTGLTSGWTNNTLRTFTW